MTSSLIYGKNENNRLSHAFGRTDRRPAWLNPSYRGLPCWLSGGILLSQTGWPAFDKGMVVIDLENGIEWLKCSIGQQWDEENCIGDMLRLPQEAMGQVMAQANEKLGGKWRLPTARSLNRWL